MATDLPPPPTAPVDVFLVPNPLIVIIDGGTAVFSCGPSDAVPPLGLRINGVETNTTDTRLSATVFSNNITYMYSNVCVNGQDNGTVLQCFSGSQTSQESTIICYRKIFSSDL